MQQSFRNGLLSWIDHKSFTCFITEKGKSVSFKQQFVQADRIVSQVLILLEFSGQFIFVGSEMSFPVLECFAVVYIYKITVVIITGKFQIKLVSKYIGFTLVELFLELFVYFSKGSFKDLF